MPEYLPSPIAQKDQTDHAVPAISLSDYHFLPAPHFAPRPLPDSLLVRTFRRRWKMMLLIFAVVLAAGITATIVLVRPTYQAVAQLRFVPRVVFDGAFVASDPRTGYSGYLATELARIPRRNIIAAAVQKLNLAAPSAVDDLLGRTSTVLQSSGQVIWLVVRGPSPEGLVEAANAVAEVYLEHDIQPIIEKHQAATQQLRDELASLRRDKQTLLSTVAGRNTDLYIRELHQLRESLVQPIRDAKADLAAAQSEYSKADARLAALQATPPDSQKIQEILAAMTKDDPLLEMYRSIYQTMIAASDQQKLFTVPEGSANSAVQNRLTEARQRSTLNPASPETNATVLEQIRKGITERLEELKAQALLEAQKLCQAEIISQRAVCDRLNQLYQAKDRSLQGLVDKDNAAATETAEVRRLAGQLDDLESQIKDHVKRLELWAAELLPPAQPILADRAAIATRVVDYRRGIFIPASLLLAAGLALGMACLVEHFDSRLTHAADIVRRVGIPVLASLPSYDGQKQDDDLWLPEEISIADYVNDQYRNIRTAILFGQGRTPRSIVVTAPTAAETKTTLSVNLAISIARSGRTVLLIDADLGNPSLADVFDVSPAPGWSDVLRDPAGLGQVTRRTRVERLSVMPAGSQLEHSAELLSSPACRSLIEALCQRFEHIIIDGPPLLDCPEGRIVAALADGVICSFSARSTRSGQARQATAILEELGAAVIGSVLNT